MEAVKILLCVVALFLLGNSYAEPTSCGAYYNQGGAPAVIENPLCSSWVLSRDFFGNHTVNCHLAAGTIKGPDEDSKDQFFCDLDLQIPFRGENGFTKDVKVGMVAIFDHHGVEEATKMAAKLLKNYFLVHVFFLRDETYAHNKFMGLLSTKEAHDMVFLELNLVKELDQLDLKIGRSSQLVKSPKTSSVGSKQDHVPGCVATIALMMKGQILVANGCNSKALLCKKVISYYVKDQEGVQIDLSAKVARKYHPRIDSERTGYGIAGGLIQRYGNWASNVTDWQPLSDVYGHLALVSNEIFEFLNEQDVCDVLSDKYFKTSVVRAPFSCKFLIGWEPNDASCIVETVFRNSEYKLAVAYIEYRQGTAYDEGLISFFKECYKARSSFNFSAAVVPLRSTGFMKERVIKKKAFPDLQLYVSN
uniref:PPM-type phosphatase domain-containing protein n=1 Tax=Fagus sylvatica TaxID=28930 RepID=A0A2N9GGQ6_FAGSY